MHDDFHSRNADEITCSQQSVTASTIQLCCWAACWAFLAPGLQLSQSLTALGLCAWPHCCTTKCLAAISDHSAAALKIVLLCSTQFTCNNKINMTTVKDQTRH